MQPSADISDLQEDERVSLQILQQLGQALRISLESTTEEPLPKDMGLLLLQVAFVEVIRGAASEEMRETGSEETAQTWVRAVREYCASSTAVMTSCG